MPFCFQLHIYYTYRSVFDLKEGSEEMLLNFVLGTFPERYVCVNVILSPPQGGITAFPNADWWHMDITRKNPYFMRMD